VDAFSGEINFRDDAEIKLADVFGGPVKLDPAVVKVGCVWICVCCVCMSACECVCVCVCAYVSFVCMSASECVCINVCVHMCLCVRMCVCQGRQSAVQFRPAAFNVNFKVFTLAFHSASIHANVALYVQSSKGVSTRRVLQRMLNNIKQL
jgi:hypothetical protein